MIAPRRQGHEYHVEARGAWFFIRTNDHAEDFQVMVAPVATPEPAQWRVLLPEEAGVLCAQIELFQDHLVILEWAGGVKRVRVVRLAPDSPEIAASHWIDFPEESYAVYTELNPVFDTCLLYTSPSPRDRTRSRMPSSA